MHIGAGVAFEVGSVAVHSRNIQQPIFKMIITSPAENLLVRASPEIWLSPRGHVDLNSLGNDPSACNFYNFPLKMFTESAETDSSSSEFQRLITCSVKKC